jgi:hypothetical protein
LNFAASKGQHLSQVHVSRAIVLLLLLPPLPLLCLLLLLL